MSALTPHGKIFIELADQAAALSAFYKSKIVGQAEPSDFDEDWADLYIKRADLETVAGHISEIARLLRTLSDELLAR
jgi:hypothetical protein